MTVKTMDEVVAREDPNEKLNRLARELREKDEELARLKAAKSSEPRELSFKVGAKGGVSVYGLGRFPVTLYVEQWRRLLHPGNVALLQRFMLQHDAELARKEG